MAFHPTRSTPRPPNSITMPQLNTQQGDLTKANLGTATPQVMGGTNPMSNANRLSMASGGAVPAPPDPTTIQAQLASVDQNKAADLSKYIDPKALGNGTETTTPAAKPSGDKTEEMFKAYENRSYPHPHVSGPMAKGQDATKKGVGHDFAQGGEVNPAHEHIKNMPLKDIVKMLASHPGLSQEGSQNFAQGGNVIPRGNQAALSPNGNKMSAFKKSTHQGLLNSQNNINVGTYAKGGDVNDLEEDQLSGTGPDGTPIVKNADGSSGYADINSLLGRPKNAPTIGTGQTPVNGVSANAANSVGQSQPPQTNQMAKGGEENGPPPGSLSPEVADNVDAKLSPGEFVMSADTVRYWGLKFFNELQEHARQELAEMNNSGGIRHPGDGKNPDDGEFMQDKPPNNNAYSPEQMGEDNDEDESEGLLKECMGGMNMHSGGGVLGEEDTYKRGGDVDGDDFNIDAAKGGIITSASSNLFPKKNEMSIPGIKVPKVPTNDKGPRSPNKQSYGLAKFEPKMKKGGLLEDKMPHQSYVC